VAVVGLTVSFSVSGSNSASGSAVTDSSGHCQFQYTGSNPGEDTITASALFGTIIKSAVAHKVWVALTNAPNLVKNNVISGTNVSIGEVFTYEISFDTFSNTVAAVALHIVDQLPIEVDFISATANGALSVVYDPGTHTVVWDFGTWPPLTAGPTNTVTVRLNANAAGETNVVNLASLVTSNLPPIIVRDRNPRCPSCTGIAVCPAPHVTITPAANRGYYQLVASSTCYDASQLQFYVHDTASAFVAGPYASGTVVKIKKSAATGIGPASGVASVTILVLGDGQVYAVDPGTQVSSVTICKSL
jgi:uncharacterized repeat protein (TIGR01451 family)